jgi:hypothetical protein
MFATYLVVTFVATGANIYAAANDFARAEWVLANMTRLGVPHSAMFTLGALKAAGALGLLIGIVIPPIGVAASLGLTLFFVGAIVTAIRAGWYEHLRYPAVFLALAAACLALRLALL